VSGTYDPDRLAAYYDACGEREWERMDSNVRNRAAFHIHRHYLERFIRAGDAVLEVGAGLGRFTIELARLGARVVVGDISPRQLDLHREKLAGTPYDAAVSARDVLDICDLSRYPEAAFDAVVCYGGPLSYVFERADGALEEMLRVTKPGGHVLLGVMSLLGTTRLFLAGVGAIARQAGIAASDRVCEAGDLRDADVSPNGHYCHMFRWSELEALLRRHPCEIVAASASNYLSAQDESALAPIAADPALWEAFLRWEADFCQEPGARDGGTHIIAVVRRQ
jgi:SAM-dependent methyltransferase